jgi:hypothetical protein
MGDNPVLKGHVQKNLAPLSNLLVVLGLCIRKVLFTLRLVGHSGVVTFKGLLSGLLVCLKRLLPYFGGG